MSPQIDLSEPLIPIKDIPGEFPNRPHIATVWRWVKRGVRGVKLETIVVGGRRYTNVAAIERFVEATTGVDPTIAATSSHDPTGVDPTIAATSGHDPARVPTPSRRHAVQQANTELDRAKI